MESGSAEAGRDRDTGVAKIVIVCCRLTFDNVLDRGLMTTEERFNRIESILGQITEAHLELETAQVNQLRAHTKLEETLTTFVDETRERITNLTIIVNSLVERDLGRSDGQI